MIPEQPIDFDRFVRGLLWVAGGVVVYMLLRQMGGALVPFALAWLAAYMINPLVEWNMRWLKSRKLSVLVTLVLSATVVVAAVLLMVPAVIRESAHLYDLLTKRVSTAQWPAWIPPALLTQLHEKLGAINYEALLSGERMEQRLAGVGSVVWKAVSGVYGVVGALFSIVTFGLYLIFILIDYDRITAGWITLVPDKYRQMVQTLANDLETGMNNYFRAQTKIVLSVSLLFCIGFKIAGIPFAISLGLMTGLLNYVPYMQLVAIPPALIIAALGGLEDGGSLWMPMLWTLVVFAVVQAIQDLFLTPRFLGAISGFNPAVVLLSLSIWGALLGLVGLIIAVPVTSLLVSWYRRKFKSPKEMPG